MRYLSIVLVAILLTACAPGRAGGRYLVLDDIHDHMTLEEFNATLQGRWESIWERPNSGNVLRLEFADDRCEVTVADGVGNPHVYRGSYQVKLERPHHPQQITYATIIARTSRGEIRLQRCWFGYHNAVLKKQGRMLRLDRAPYGVLAKLAD